MIDEKQKGRYIYITVAIKDEDLCNYINELQRDSSTNLSAYLRKLIRKDMEFKRDWKEIKEAIDNGEEAKFKF